MKKNIILTVLVLFGLYVSKCAYQPSLNEGHELAEKHCQSCHRFPEPGLLDKKTWARYVLPKMGDFMGFRHLGSGSYIEAGNAPELMPLTDWEKIVRYYLAEALDSLAEEPEKAEIRVGLKDFDLMIPAFSVSSAATTYTGILGTNQIAFADGIAQQLYRLQANGQVQDSFKTGEGMVNASATETEIYSLAMGVLYPSDEKKGKLEALQLPTLKSNTVLDDLQRPVHAVYGDLNGDRLQDIVVCEFGNLTGQLSWFEKGSGLQYRKHVLRAFPGAVRSQIVDANKDGRPDVIALMAQGDEGIFVYYNQGEGRFEEMRVLQFPPSYGSNYFELADFNKDGYPDILATNGDNGDYPALLKPYHGIRIYLNDGSYRFKEILFLPVNGASKAMARDFDGDGDLDIASISYFPDFEHRPEESFIYWENEGDLSFRPSTFREVLAGRWLTMDAGDIDGDGDIDLLLGNAKFPLGAVPGWLMKKWEKGVPSVVILRNKQFTPNLK